NYPNPFNPSTTIQFELPVEAQVTLKVFNIIGQEIATLADRRFGGGVHSVQWNGLNKYNQNAASGIYIYRLIAVPANAKDRFIQTRKMMLLK
ncbi:MAG: T9SS type A sorting domain-containing protein, partial [Bacteroidetes bacterium]|nr:T9SS type A sorting domain-containing protein [Bacteroidota bacterium]